MTSKRAAHLAQAFQNTLWQMVAGTLQPNLGQGELGAQFFRAAAHACHMFFYGGLKRRVGHWWSPNAEYHDDGI